MVSRKFLGEKRLETVIKNQFQLEINSIHGIGHWERVEKIGFYLAEETTADLHVISLFAYIHDCKRKNEDEDPKHGERAAKYAEQLFSEGTISLSGEQLEQLVFACKHHSEKRAKSSDITVLTCWDSDRLDLWRVDIEPDPKFLFTNVARKRETKIFSLGLLNKGE